MGHENWVSDMKESAASMNNSSHNFDGSWTQSPQVNWFEALNALPSLGLQLTPTPLLLNEVERILLQRGYNNGVNGELEQGNSSSNAYAMTIASKDIMLQQANKLKAENFLISSLRIGSWERVSRHEGDLVAKCYFAKRKLVWEFLENGLKSKIEIQWSDILSLKGVCLEGQPGILEIELTQPPAFFHEIDPKPRKHTQWRTVTDFTGGQAPTYRRHHLKFHPGVLDRPLEKLLRNDSRLFQLSQQGYPTLKSPYFPKPTFGDFSFDFGGQSHISPPQEQLSFGNVPTPYQIYEPAPLNSSLSEYGNNQMPYWDGQGGINNQIPNHIRGTMMPTIPSDAGSSISFENNYTPLSQNQVGGLISMQQQSSMFQTRNDDYQNMLLNHSQNGFSNSISEGNFFLQGHLRNNMIHVSPNMVDTSALMNIGFSDNVVAGGQMYPQVMNWAPDNNSLSPSVNNDDLNHEINIWTHDINRNKWQ